MDFDIQTARPLLARTPVVLNALLRDLPEPWITNNEGAETWNPFDVIGHLVHGERSDWIPRVEHILKHGDAVAFTPFDRFAQFNASQGKSLSALLDEFSELRASSLRRLDALALTQTDLSRAGLHPALGKVALGQLLATWTVHDLDHIVQISRCMARNYTEAVGPWREYLRIVRQAP
ncbi:MAG: DinB family protein [Gemmatimonadaceae bacterium]